MRQRKWTTEELRNAAKEARSLAQILIKLNLVPKGGNYQQIAKYLRENNVDVSQLKGRGWKKGLTIQQAPRIPLENILVKNSDYQSFKLKNRLLSANLKQPKCEICGWAKRSPDGYLPLELDHVNSDHRDNRIENLRILCPNCHSLQPTHRGRKRK